MTHGAAFVAVDLGAESGRVFVGTIPGDRVHLEQVHRFPNLPIHTPDGLHWDVPRLYAEILEGLRSAARLHGDAIVGIGIDSWGVDYGLLDAGGRLLGLPYHYRDARTDGMPEEVAERVPAAEQYARTGIAQLSINTLYQLAAQLKARDRTLDLAESLLMIPDLLHYWLTGERAAEHTIASTTGMLDVDGVWAVDLLTRLDLPGGMLRPVVSPGTVLGGLRPAVREECGLGTGYPLGGVRVRVILPGGHDTACAVAAVPSVPHAAGMSHAYISSGTWSLLGLEMERPIATEDARLAGFTNERGIAGTYRFLTNIAGLWLLQECRRSWARQGREWTYDDLTARAASAPSPEVIIDVDNPEFLHPDDMPAAIAAYLRYTGQPAVSEDTSLARAILEGLALQYHLSLQRAELLSGMRVDTIHVVGGGARNSLLCQLTADACGRPVVAGPAEATALGNVLVQAMGVGEIRDLAEAHAVARRSADLRTYEPRTGGDWEDRAARLDALRSRAAEMQPVPNRE